MKAEPKWLLDMATKLGKEDAASIQPKHKLPADDSLSKLVEIGNNMKTLKRKKKEVLIKVKNDSAKVTLIDYTKERKELRKAIKQEWYHITSAKFSSGREKYEQDILEVIKANGFEQFKSRLSDFTKESIENGDAFWILFNEYWDDTEHKAEVIENKYCCEDFKITVEDYKHITSLNGFTRFSGHHIHYCPYCGKKLKEA